MSRYLSDEAHAAMVDICQAPIFDLSGQPSAAPCPLAEAYLASGSDAARFFIAAAFVAEGWKSSSVEASERFWLQIELVQHSVESQL